MLLNKRYEILSKIGGLLRPVKGGTYRVNDKMLEDARAQELAEMLSEYTGGISAVLEIFSNYLQDKIGKSISL